MGVRGSTQSQHMKENTEYRGDQKGGVAFNL